jgi:hypothetical protein
MILFEMLGNEVCVWRPGVCVKTEEVAICPVICVWGVCLLCVASYRHFL